MIVSFRTLREANAARQAEWDADNAIDLAYRGNELAGEVGEACNIIKKLERERLGIRGSRATVGELADELADVVICLDLIGMVIGGDVMPVIDDIGSRITPDEGITLTRRGGRLVHRTGMVCRAIDVGYSSVVDIPTPNIKVALVWAASEVAFLAKAVGIDLGAAVEAKFNSTSVRYGLATRYHAPWRRR